jgi:hypothetical protein
MTRIKRTVFLPRNRVLEKNGRVSYETRFLFIDYRYVKMSGEVGISRLIAEYSYK